MSDSNRHRGFSQIELLTVIAIVVVLTAILIPALRGVRESSYSTKCAANLRQLATAGLHYLNDHNGVFHSRNLEHPSTHASAPGISDYLGFEPNKWIYEDTVYTCPAEQAGDKPSAYIYHRTYSVNEWTINYPTKKPSPESSQTYAPKIDDFVNPSATSYIMDGTINTDAQLEKGFRYFNHLNESQVDTIMRYPHNKKINVVYLDGRVESFTREEMPRVRYTYFWWGDISSANRYR